MKGTAVRERFDTEWNHGAKFYSNNLYQCWPFNLELQPPAAKMKVLSLAAASC